MRKIRRHALAAAFGTLASHYNTRACWRGYLRAWKRHGLFHYAQRVGTHMVPKTADPRSRT